MGKRSTFPRRKQDDYPTIDPRAVPPLLPHLRGIQHFAEPCAGEGSLIAMLESAGLTCDWRSDIADGRDALQQKHFGVVDAIITNPPWSRDVLHRMIRHFERIAPTWLLFDADWAHTRQAAPFLDQCSHIVSVGRLRWIEGSPHYGKDNVAWYRFHAQHAGGPRFVAPLEKVAA